MRDEPQFHASGGPWTQASDLFVSLLCGHTRPCWAQLLSCPVLHRSCSGDLGSQSLHSTQRAPAGCCQHGGGQRGRPGSNTGEGTSGQYGWACCAQCRGKGEAGDRGAPCSLGRQPWGLSTMSGLVLGTGSPAALSLLWVLVTSVPSQNPAPATLPAQTTLIPVCRPAQPRAGWVPSPRCLARAAGSAPVPIPGILVGKKREEGMAGSSHQEVIRVTTLSPHPPGSASGTHGCLARPAWPPRQSLPSQPPPLRVATGQPLPRSPLHSLMLHPRSACPGQTTLP